MGRPERPIAPDGSPVAWFAADLRRLRVEAGTPTYRRLGERTHYTPSVLSDAARGERLPTWPVTRAYVVACGGDVAAWRERWLQIAAPVPPTGPAGRGGRAGTGGLAGPGGLAGLAGPAGERRERYAETVAERLAQPAAVGCSHQFRDGGGAATHASTVPRAEAASTVRLRAEGPTSLPLERERLSSQDSVIAVRIGYARAVTTARELPGQLEALARARCARVFSERVGPAVKAPPQLAAALRLARSLKGAAPERAVILTVPDLRRLARTATELAMLVAALQSAGVQLEVLSGPLVGVFDPKGKGSLLFAAFAAAAQVEREHARERTRPGPAGRLAADRGPGRPRVVDEDMLAAALRLREQGMPVPEIAARLVITTGRNAGRHPSVASVYRALAAARPLADRSSPERPG